MKQFLTCLNYFYLCFLQYCQESNLTGKGRRANKYQKKCGESLSTTGTLARKYLAAQSDLDQNKPVSIHLENYQPMVKSVTFPWATTSIEEGLYSTPIAHGNWTYQIENDSSVVYRVRNTSMKTMFL
jgi:hypothetical protein